MRRYDGAQTHAGSERWLPTPVLSLAYTPRQAEAYDRTMWRIEPEAPILLQVGKLRSHIVLTALTFQHGHPHRVQVSPSGFQTAKVSAVAGELVGIGAATVGPTFSRSDEAGYS